MILPLMVRRSECSPEDRERPPPEPALGVVDAPYLVVYGALRSCGVFSPLESLETQIKAEVVAPLLDMFIGIYDSHGITQPCFEK
jgi:hypothetical protein